MIDSPVSLDYRAFLESKFKFSRAIGFDVTDAEINPELAPITRAVIPWLCQGGRRAAFMAFGLHKTALAIEVMRLIGRRERGYRLIVLPLGVRQEFMRDAAERFHGAFGVTLKFVRTADELEGDEIIYLTNYESVRDGKLDPNRFIAAWLDEASVLRSFGSKTYQTFLTLFDQVKYRFVGTATPSPNRYKELIHYAGFLGIMDTGQALTRFFQRDSTQANNLTLYPHMEREFFTWMHTWALFVQRPSDLGLSDDGYTLPELVVRYHEIPATERIGRADSRGQVPLIANAAMSLSDAADEKRQSIPARVAKMREIVAASPADHFLLWHTLEDERHAIVEAVPGAVSVYGTQDWDEREGAILDFSNGKIQHLSTKPEIAGSGCNFQRHCHRAIQVGIDYRFNDFIQSIYRIQRFGQSHQVELDVIYTEGERDILTELLRKWAEDTALRVRMSEIIRTYGLASAELEQELGRTIGCQRRVVTGEQYEIVNNDCVDEVARMASNSVDLIHTSIPFGNHYEYSASYNDFGHNEDNGAFFRQMDYLTPELLRILKPGRIAAIHVKDRIRFGNVTGDGFPTQDSFHEECVLHYKRHGFRKIGMITVVTDVVRENNQTYRLSWTEQCKDGTKMGVGSPEYVLLFRKLPTDTTKGYADERVVKSKADFPLAAWQIKAHAFWRSSGDRLLTADEVMSAPPELVPAMFEQFSLTHVYDLDEHVRIAQALDDRGVLPRTFMSIAPASHHADVWHDVTRMRTLNGEQTRRGLANHVCPLQFDIVDRVIERFSNPGDVVFDPFGGIMTVPYRAVKLGRYGRAVELNPSYFDDGAAYMQATEQKQDVPSLLAFAESMSEPAGVE